jgi:uncharacterized LabA/DUF88 family protein
MGKFMIEQFTEGRVYVFIDAENLFYSQRTLGWKISYQRLMNYFRKECGKEIRGYIPKELLERAKFLDLRKIKAEIGQNGSISSP